jgi:hypothetical protein
MVQNIAVEFLVFMIYIRKILGSNFGPEISCSDWWFLCFPSVYAARFWDSTLS